MKFFFFLLLIQFVFTSSSLAEVDTTLQDLKEQGSLANLRNIKNQEVDNYLLDNQLMKDCQKLYKNQGVDLGDETIKNKIKECFMKTLGDIDDNQIKKIGTDLNLEGYGVVKNNSVGAIKGYFDQRLSETLFGKKDIAQEGMLKLKDQKFVDQELFVQLYDNQLSKNTLLKVSEFCVDYKYTSGGAGCNQKTSPHKCFESKNKQSRKYKDVKQRLEADSKNNPDDIRDNWKNCAGTIQYLCKYYKKNLTKYGNSPTAPTPTPTAKEEYSSIEESNTSVTDEEKEMLRRSCVVVDHLKKHRVTLKKLEKTKEEFKKMKSQQGVNLGATFSKTYSGNRSGNDKNLDELTTVASNDIVSQYDKFGDDKNLAEECMKSKDPNNKKCEEFFRVVEGKDQKKLILDYELKTLVEAQHLQNKLGEMDKDEFEEFLVSQGENEQAAKIKDLAKEDIEKIKIEFRNNLKAERTAMINELKNNLKKLEVNKNDVSSGSAAKKVDEAAKKVINREENLKGLYHYSNIVTSYLQNSNTGKSTGTGWNAEREAAGNSNNEDAYFRQLESENFESSNSSSSSTLVDLKFLNQLLEEKEQKEN